MADIFLIRTLWGTYIWWFCYCYPRIWARRIMSIFCLKLTKTKNCRVYIYIKIKESYKIEELLILGEHLGSSRWFSGSVFILGEHLGSSRWFSGSVFILGEHLGSSRWFSGSVFILGEHLGSSQWLSGSVFILGEHLGSSRWFSGYLVGSFPVI